LRAARNPEHSFAHIAGRTQSQTFARFLSPNLVCIPNAGELCDRLSKSTTAMECTYFTFKTAITGKKSEYYYF
jgi:hypothetical protein